MKTFGLFILIAIFSFAGFSQDTLYTTGGKVITGKVTEISQTEIKYKSASNPDGPLYVIDKSTIVLIEYKNGSKDVFQNSSTNSSNTNSDNSTQGNNNSSNYVTRRPSFNIIVGPTPFFAWGGGWGVNRSYYRGGGYRYHGHHSHYGHSGHYGRRGH